MTKKRKQTEESKLIKSADSMMEALRKTGTVSDLRYNEYKAFRVSEPKQYTAVQIKKIRKKAHCSQSVFAEVICVSAKTIQNWEQGIKTPSRQSYKL